MFDLLNFIWDAIKSIWNFIKKIIVSILRFVRDILSWFEQRLRIIQNNKDLLAVVVKEKLKNGEYNVVNCLFDKKKEEIVETEEDIVAYNTEKLDKQTKKYFGNKDMIILQ